MSLFLIVSVAALILCAAVLIISYICFRIGFYAAPRKDNGGEIELPVGEIYEPFWPAMRKWAEETRALPQEEVSITSFDGLKLYGKYYEYAPGAPIELMFHGYRGAAERDLAGGVQRCFKVGRSALIVDQRCAGKSEGSVITFGVNEHRDCLAWVDFMLKKFGPDVKIILTGISMGASTVLIAGGQKLPDNVIGILADCGFTSAKEIVMTVIKQFLKPECQRKTADLQLYFCLPVLHRYLTGSILGLNRTGKTQTHHASLHRPHQIIRTAVITDILIRLHPLFRLGAQGFCHLFLPVNKHLVQITGNFLELLILQQTSDKFFLGILFVFPFHHICIARNQLLAFVFDQRCHLNKIFAGNLQMKLIHAGNKRYVLVRQYI
jgi:hypothetical protein